jgi:ribosome biogenesis protein Nip4
MQNDKGRRLKFSLPTTEEEKRIRSGLAEYVSEQRVNQLLADQYILIARGRRQEVYILSSAVLRLYMQIQSQRHPYFVGRFLGELTKTTLQPSLHILSALGDAVKEAAKVMTTLKGEQRFLYGQPLERQHLKDWPAISPPNKKVVVVNEKGEGLGYGLLKSTEKVTIKNQQDLGWYLRRGH